MRFVAAVGATMAAANYPVTIVRAIMDGTSRAYGLDNEFLALRNYVQVGRPSGEGVCMVNADMDLRCGQSFPLAQLVARAPSGMVSPEEGLAVLDRIRNQERRFPAWVTRVGYAVQSTPHRRAVHDC